jgi:cyclopropane fatty-acyl-phospholipid synthase-like methyltransferase
VAWYKHWFNHPLYLEVYQHRDREEARDAVRLITSSLHLQAGERILDLGCGAGRHAIELAKQGYNVSATDLSPMLLNVARKTARDESAALNLIRSDMRYLPFCKSFDAVVQLFTAFGYFSADEENIGVIQEVSRILKPGGRYLLDFLNAPFVNANLKPRSEDRYGNTTVVQERAVRNGRVEKTIRVQSNDEDPMEFHESVRMYTVDELSAMFEACGLRVDNRFGDYRGLPLNPSSPRCILVATNVNDT